MKTICNNNVIWLGTAEANHKRKGEKANESMRVRAALVATKRLGKEKVLVEWEGKWIPEQATVFTREYEDAASGDLIGDVDAEIAGRLDLALIRGRK